MGVGWKAHPGMMTKLQFVKKLYYFEDKIESREFARWVSNAFL